MDNLKEILSEILHKEILVQAVLSNAREKGADSPGKTVIKPVMLKQKLYYQFSHYYTQKVLHENLEEQEVQTEILRLLEEQYRQGLFQTKDADIQVLIGKKGKLSIIRKNVQKRDVRLAHNRKKNYILEEGVPAPFLVDLGVMTPEGKVHASRYDKFRQINRFLEMIDDILPILRKKSPLHIVDFGCGKSYLTFALYYYLKEMKGLDIQIIGLDLKKDVIAHCNHLTEKFGYECLSFQVGDIAEYQGMDRVDMVVTLHACDTATDAALEKAVRWGSDVILSVPCCQHELLSQVENPTLEPLLSHGILKERFSALATDAVRAQILDILGYKTQILEFIDMEHTPKNLLIRAIKGENSEIEKKMQAYLDFKKHLGIQPYLERALGDMLKIKKTII